MNGILQSWVCENNRCVWRLYKIRIATLEAWQTKLKALKINDLRRYTSRS